VQCCIVFQQPVRSDHSFDADADATLGQTNLSPKRKLIQGKSHVDQQRQRGVPRTSSTIQGRKIDSRHLPSTFFLLYLIHIGIPSYAIHIALAARNK
jgi:hypothetical protein